MTDRLTMLRGDTVYRVHWRLGTDLLVGVCHCGAERDFEDPVVLWDWLLAHPRDHDSVPTGPIPTGPVPTGPVPTGPVPTGPVPTGRQPMTVGAP